MAEEIKKATVNGFSVACIFALDDKAKIMDVRKKSKNLVANSKAHKMPVRLLEPSFVSYVGHCKLFLVMIAIVDKMETTVKLNNYRTA